MRGAPVGGGGGLCRGLPKVVGSTTTPVVGRSLSPPPATPLYAAAPSPPTFSSLQPAMSVSAFAFTPSSALLPAAPHSTPFPASPPTTITATAAAVPLHGGHLSLSSRPVRSSLLDSIETKTRQARSSGTLQTIHTRCHLIKDTKTVIDERSPLQFPVRIKTEGATYNKPDVLADNVGKRDPFVPPYEEDLFIEWDFSVGPAHSPASKHVLVLNKFNVLPNHALIVTTDFQPQTDPLNAHDFEVFWRSVDDVKGFGFYNCGANAGPSQPHKHMQVVPLPLEDGTELPLLRLLDEHTAAADTDNCTPFTLPRFPFNHAVCRLPKHLGREADSQTTGRDLAEMYRRLLAAVHVTDGQNELDAPTNGHHNVLLSPRWMLVVPRTREGTDGLSGNGLVFAGVFFAKDQQLCDKLADIGPINFLTRITS